MVTLTPHLKHSDPMQTRMYEERHVFKRSNSQTEFDFTYNNVLEEYPMPGHDPAHEFQLQHSHSFNHQIEKQFYNPPFANLGASYSSAANHVIEYQCRNSFDFLEMESTNLLEMTGNSYKRLVNQNLFSQFQSMPTFQEVPQNK